MDLSGSEKPVGTLEELKEAGLSPTQFGSCSPRDNRNKGCAWFNFCRFREWRDRVNGKKGPLNFVAHVALSPAEGGVANNPEMPCFDYYYSGLYARQRDSANTGEVIKVIGVEGDGKKYKSRISVRAHPKPVAGCLACSDGKCIKRESKFHESEITPFARPGQAFTELAESARMRDEMLMDEESATTSAALAKGQEMIGGTTPRKAG